MFGSTILEMAIGLILVFLVMSLICSAIREGIEAFAKHRALDLEHGIRELLQDPDGQGLTRELYSHPLVFGMFQGAYEALPKRKWFARGSNLPSYIPGSNVARALIDLDQQGRINSPAFKTVLRSLSAETGDDVVQLRKNIEQWFDSAGDRIGGWYKRRTQILLLGLGFTASVALNVNSIVIADSLFHSSELRTAVVASAERFAATNPVDAATQAASAEFHNSVTELHNMADIGLPMGWGKGRPSDVPLYVMLLGWLITGFAVTLGAPFWFDLLNKVVSVRSTVKPKVKTAEPAEPATPAPATSTTPVAPAERRAVRVGDVTAAPVPVPPIGREPFQPHEWASADVEEGVL